MQYNETYDVALFNSNELKQIDRALEDVRICDPAIGSGAFPMGLLHEIYNLKIPIEDNKGLKAKSPADLKKHIIEESIYGVDIDSGAVDIARLRFWLSLVVDEVEPKPLPNLAFKIVCANTLIPLGMDNTIQIAGATSIIKQIEKIRHDYFTASKEDKKDLERQFKNEQNKLWVTAKDWLTTKDADLYKKISEFNPFEDTSCTWFDAKWMFGINDGFDIVIGNPPYIKEPTNRNAFDGFRKTKYYQGKMDLWYGFACVMLDNLKKETGILTFIATNNWVTNAGASKFRNKVVADAQILQLIDFGNYKIFESADIQTMIMLFKSTNKEAEYNFDYRRIIDTQVELDDVIQVFNRISNDKARILNPTFNRGLLTDKSFLFSEGGIDDILNQILNASNFQLDDRLEIAQGIVAPQDFVNKTSAEELGGSVELNEGIFYLTDKEKNQLNLTSEELKLIKPFYSTTELERYFGDKKNKYWVIYTDSSFKNPDAIKPYPNLKKHLDRFQKVITSDNKPYGLHRARNEYFFVDEKIISLRKCAKPTFTYTNFDCYVSQTYFVIKTSRINQKYLTALLNSKLIAFWLKHKGKMQGFQYQVDKGPLIELPLITSTHQDTFATLVDYLLYLYDNTNPQALPHTANTRLASHIEDVLNMMVYELYFSVHMIKNEIDVLKFIKVDPFSDYDKDINKESKILEFYTWFLSPDNLVRQRIKVVDIKSPNLISKINSSTI